MKRGGPYARHVAEVHCPSVRLVLLLLQPWVPPISRFSIPARTRADSDVEYGGLADFERYRRQEREWLAGEVRTPEYRNAPL